METINLPPQLQKIIIEANPNPNAASFFRPGMAAVNLRSEIISAPILLRMLKNTYPKDRLTDEHKNQLAKLSAPFHRTKFSVLYINSVMPTWVAIKYRINKADPPFLFSYIKLANEIEDYDFYNRNSNYRKIKRENTQLRDVDLLKFSKNSENKEDIFLTSHSIQGIENYHKFKFESRNTDVSLYRAEEIPALSIYDMVAMNFKFELFCKALFQCLLETYSHNKNTNLRIRQINNSLGRAISSAIFLNKVVPNNIHLDEISNKIIKLKNLNCNSVIDCIFPNYSYRTRAYPLAQKVVKVFVDLGLLSVEKKSDRGNSQEISVTHEFMSLFLRYHASACSFRNQLMTYIQKS